MQEGNNGAFSFNSTSLSETATHGIQAGRQSLHNVMGWRGDGQYIGTVNHHSVLISPGNDDRNESIGENQYSRSGHQQSHQQIDTISGEQGNISKLDDVGNNNVTGIDCIGVTSSDNLLNRAHGNLTSRNNSGIIINDTGQGERRISLSSYNSHCHENEVRNRDYSIQIDQPDLGDSFNQSDRLGVSNTNLIDNYLQTNIIPAVETISQSTFRTDSLRINSSTPRRSELESRRNSNNIGYSLTLSSGHSLAPSPLSFRSGNSAGRLRHTSTPDTWNSHRGETADCGDPFSTDTEIEEDIPEVLELEVDEDVHTKIVPNLRDLRIKFDEEHRNIDAFFDKSDTSSTLLDTSLREEENDIQTNYTNTEVPINTHFFMVLPAANGDEGPLVHSRTPEKFSSDPIVESSATLHIPPAVHTTIDEESLSSEELADQVPDTPNNNNHRPISQRLNHHRFRRYSEPIRVSDIQHRETTVDVSPKFEEQQNSFGSDLPRNVPWGRHSQGMVQQSTSFWSSNGEPVASPHMPSPMSSDSSSALVTSRSVLRVECLSVSVVLFLLLQCF